MKKRQALQGGGLMRTANVDGRLKLLVAGGAVDVATASRGQFGPDPQEAYERFDDLRRWAATIGQPSEAFSPETAGPPSPAPHQVFAVALNYPDHAAESGLNVPEAPVVFPKYVSSFSGPVTEVTLPVGSTDWKVEVVAVMARTARAVRREEAWEYVAGLTTGQDLSERVLQRSGPAPQFGLAKSLPGFSPMGPALVTPDDVNRADDLGLGCDLNGEEMQKGRTSEMIFSVPELIAYLSSVVTLLPGDVIFTGTPPGRTPPRYLSAGDRLHSWVDGIGDLHQRFVTAPTAFN